MNTLLYRRGETPEPKIGLAGPTDVEKLIRKAHSIFGIHDEILQKMEDLDPGRGF